MARRLCALLLLAACSAPPPVTTPGAKESSSLAPIVIVRVDAPQSTSSGVVYRCEEVGEQLWDVYVLTVEHAVRDGVSKLDLFYIEDDISKMGTVTQGIEILHQDDPKDVAVIRFQSRFPLPEQVISNRAPGFMEPLAAIGCPLGMDPHVTLGQAVRSSNEIPGMWLTNVNIANGNSGGPVVSLRTGEILGVTSVIFWELRGVREFFFPHINLFSPSFLFWQDLQQSELL